MAGAWLGAAVLHNGNGSAAVRLHDEFPPGDGFVESGPHHEIYLSDPRRVAPEKLRTVLRQPVPGQPVLRQPERATSAR